MLVTVLPPFSSNEMVAVLGAAVVVVVVVVLPDVVVVVEPDDVVVVVVVSSAVVVIVVVSVGNVCVPNQSQPARTKVVRNMNRISKIRFFIKILPLFYCLARMTSCIFSL